MDNDYRANEREDLPAELAAVWSVDISEPAGYLVASGKCPACAHDTRYFVRSEIETVGAAAEESVPVEQRTTRIIPCACNASHAGRPPKLKGCGRWWLADVVPSDDSQAWHLEPSQDDRMLTAAEALSDAEPTQLSDVRAAAEKWLPGLAALYGLFGLAGVVSGRSSIAELPSGGKWTVAALALAGLVATVVSIMCGYRAAYGWPRNAKVMTNHQLQVWYDDRNGQAGKAAALLRTALIWALVALVALLLATGTLWFWPAR